jgi:hypothetical protein
MSHDAVRNTVLQRRQGGAGALSPHVGTPEQSTGTCDTGDALVGGFQSLQRRYRLSAVFRPRMAALTRPISAMKPAQRGSLF